MKIFSRRKDVVKTLEPRKGSMIFSNRGYKWLFAKAAEANSVSVPGQGGRGCSVMMPAKRGIIAYPKKGSTEPWTWFA